MTSEEFLNKLIVFSKEQINYYENKIAEDEKYPSLQQCHQEELKSAQEGLNHFLKIKQDLDELKRCQDTIKKWMNDHKQLIIDNGKMKIALDILKDVVSLNCDKVLETERQFLRLSQGDYELLNEVLNYE